LRNVATHADAGTVHVTLREVGGDIILTITDDGRGFDASATRAITSLGLRSIDERVRLAQGRCQIKSAPGLGTTVTVALPLSVSRAASQERTAV